MGNKNKKRTNQINRDRELIEQTINALIDEGLITPSIPPPSTIIRPNTKELKRLIIDYRPLKFDYSTLKQTKRKK